MNLYDLISSFITAPASCFANNSCACEYNPLVLGAVQPINAISSLIFLVPGLLIIKQGKKSPLAKIFGGAIIIMGIVAFIYHFYMTLPLQILDYVLVSICFIIPEVYLVYREKFNWIILGLFLLFFVIEIFIPYHRYILPVTMIVYILFKNILIRRNFNKFIPILSLMALGGVLWIFDDRLMCDSVSIIQIHAIFHLVMACLAYVAFKYYYNLVSWVV